MPDLRSSLLSASQAAASAVAFDEVRVAAGAVWWLESRPLEGGRVALMRLGGGAPPLEATSPGVDVGCDLHGYGGGAYAVDGDRVYYINRDDGNVYVLDGASGMRVLMRRRHDREHIGDLAAADGRLWCVRETSAGDELLEVVSDGVSRVLVKSDGFLGSPRPQPGKLAWLRWNEDRMPWDSSELMVAEQLDGRIGPAQRIAGGPDESVTQPQWDQHDRLWFMSDRTDWWNLYRWDGAGITAVAPMMTDVAPPEWEAGYHGFSVLPDGGALLISSDGFRHELILVDRDGQKPIESSYSSFKPYLAADADQLYAIAASPTQSSSVVSIRLKPSVAVEVVVVGPTETITSDLSEPEVLRCPTGDGAVVSALVYPPSGASAAWCAPLIVRAHPGPTSSVTTRLDWHVQYLTSQGFAVVDVDYRGSSGYGRVFRRRLYGHWGTADVQDCSAIAEYLLGIGRTRPGQVFISGASAGGYTALQAVSRPSPFAGAVARSTIIDPSRWGQTAPRWQRPHAVVLAGPAGAVRADQIQRPVLLIHGSNDHVAPLDDARHLVRDLDARGLPHRFLLLDARHDLSAQQPAAQALEAEGQFYIEHLAP